MKHRSFAPPLALCVGLCLSTATFAAQEKPTEARAQPEYFAPPSTGGTPLPFSEAVKFGDTLYVSGQIGNLPGTLTLAPGGIEAEARRTLDNMKAILERHGSSMEQVVKCTVFLADIKEWPVFNAIYREYFKTNLPARSALGANGLALGARVEVECIAFVPPKK
ncbi:MAG TPA: RidA family protein [Opitutus sp.]|nr:RidA family protein [Opitutus sp.]